MTATYRSAALLKPPVWTWEVPVYFFVGGLAGAAAVVAAAAHFTTAQPVLARDAKWIAAAGGVISPLLLISDLGRPARFLNMLRVFKLRSPMSVGAWTLVLFSNAAIGALLLPIGILADVSTAVAALTGAVLATYTGVLIGATVIPVWSRNADILPIHFGASGLGAAVSTLELIGHRTPAMNALGLLAAATETVLVVILLRRGSSSGPLMHGAEILSGPLPLALRAFASHVPAVRILTAVLTLAGSLLTRIAWLRAGRQSAARDKS